MNYNQLMLTDMPEFKDWAKTWRKQNLKNKIKKQKRSRKSKLPLIYLPWEQINLDILNNKRGYWIHPCLTTSKHLKKLNTSNWIYYDLLVNKYYYIDDDLDCWVSGFYNFKNSIKAVKIFNLTEKHLLHNYLKINIDNTTIFISFNNIKYMNFKWISRALANYFSIDNLENSELPIDLLLDLFEFECFIEDECIYKSMNYSYSNMINYIKKISKIPLESDDPEIIGRWLTTIRLISTNKKIKRFVKTLLFYFANYYGF